MAAQTGGWASELLVEVTILAELFAGMYFARYYITNLLCLDI